jgi:hypothetical protein
MKKLLLVPTAVIALLLASFGAGAAPMHTDFATIRKDAASVMIGTVRVNAASDITIDVDKVIRGRAMSGTIKVKPSPDGHIDVSNERVVAFLTASDELRWIGTKSAGASIETARASRRRHSSSAT